jgi:hypothetical protein
VIARLALLCFTLPAVCQSTGADLLGTLRDPAGLPVSGGRVEVSNTATGYNAIVESTIDGQFQFIALPAGPYRLHASKTGFNPLNREGMALRVADRVVLDLTLELGASSQEIEVSAAAPFLQTTRGAVSFVTEQRKVVSLPLDGRNFVPLIALNPGVNLPPGNLLPRINGSRPRVSEYIYDGVSVLQPEPGQVVFYPIIDSIEEFRVELNSYSAEFGRSNGGVILVNQKSGSNEFRGTLFEFFRNEKLNARNLFATAGAKPRFRRNQYGFVLGGPIRENRTFFFTDWQRSALSTGVVRVSTVPLPGQWRGVFPSAITDPQSRQPFPANTIPASRIDTAARTLIVRYPEPTAAGAANNFRRIATDAADADQLDYRVDHYVNDRHRLFLRYGHFRDTTRTTTPLPDPPNTARTRAGSLAAEHTATFSASAVNQFRFGHTRRAFGRASAREQSPAGIPNIPRSAFADVPPTIDIAGFQSIGPAANSNARFSTSVSQLLDTFTWTRAAHTLKAGADIRLQSLNVLQPSSPSGNFEFTSLFTGNSLASFLTGYVNRFTIDVQPDQIEPRAKVAEFFLQDDWRATRRLTLNLGVRYTLNFPSTIRDDRGAVFNLETQRLDYLGRNGFPRTARNLEIANFAPRAGLAYRLADTFVIRAGYGLTWIEQAGITTPFTTPLFPFVQSLTQQTLDNITPAFLLAAGPTVTPRPPAPDAGLGQGVFAVQRDNGSGYAQQWNLSLQKTWADTWSLEAGYLASKLTRLGVPDVNLNQLTVAQLQLGAALTEQVPNPYPGPPTVPRAQLLRPFPRFNAVSLYRNNIGHSTYHSFQSRLERRFARRVTFTAAYTFSKLIDDAGAVFDSAVLTGPVLNYQAADSFNRRLEKDASTGHMPHIFSAGFVVELPRGFQLAGLARAQSGSPLAVTQVTNRNAFAGFGVQRPNRIASAGLPAGARSTARWFDTAAFTEAPQFTLGNSSRNPVTGPSYRTLDVMVGKTFQLAERLRLELRLEAFNTLNTPPLAAPNTSFGAPAFGSISSALDPRVFEAVLKIHF